MKLPIPIQPPRPRPKCRGHLLPAIVAAALVVAAVAVFAHGCAIAHAIFHP